MISTKGSETQVPMGEVPMGEAVENTASDDSKARERLEHECVLDFFSSRENALKLRHFVSRHSREVTVFFLTHFDQSLLENPPDFDIAYKYRLAITNNRKKYFDFLIEPGKGDFYLGVLKNPSLPTLQDLTVPNLVAIRWFLMQGMDEPFHKNRTIIEMNYERFKMNRKNEYRENSVRKQRLQLQKNEIKRFNASFKKPKYEKKERTTLLVKEPTKTN